MNRWQRAACLGISVLLAQACVFSDASSTPTSIPSTPISDTAAPGVETPPLLHLISEQGKYEVWLPVSEGVLDYTVTNQIAGRPIDCHITFSRLDYAYAVVEYCDLSSEAATRLTPSELLWRTREDMLRPFKAQAELERTSLADDAYPSLMLSGRVDLRGLGDDGAFDARIILVGNRVYFVLMAASDGDLCRCAALRPQVVDSFQVVTDLSIPFEPSP